ncbi:MAG: type II secretion system F family protein [Eubacteriales bacterium]|nr:type II secretion system F family protein [Eubacteriales bacterium]
MNGSGSEIFVFVISILAALLFFLLTIAVMSSLMKDKLVVQKRMKGIFNNESIKAPVIPQGSKKSKNVDWKKIKLSQALTNELQTAGIMMRPEEFAIFWVVLSFVPSGLIALLTGNLILAVIFAVLGIIVPVAYVKNQKKKRVTAFENQLGDALVVMCNCLRSGLTLSQAFENISNEAGDPIAKEFSRVCTETKYGIPLEKALNSMVERIGSDDLMLTVSAINIQRQVGGNLSEILQNISETIKARLKLKGEIKVLTATGRASGIVIGLLPIGLGLIISLLNPNYMIEFIRSDIGKLLLGIGAVMEFIGFMMIKKIVAIKY